MRRTANFILYAIYMTKYYIEKNLLKYFAWVPNREKMALERVF